MGREHDDYRDGPDRPSRRVSGELVAFLIGVGIVVLPIVGPLLAFLFCGGGFFL